MLAYVLSVTQMALWDGRWSVVKLKEEGICASSEGLSITLDHFHSQRHRNHKKEGVKKLSNRHSIPLEKVKSSAVWQAEKQLVFAATQKLY